MKVYRLTCYRYSMRIVQIIARYNKGGTANWLDLLVSGLRNEGDEVILIAGHVDSSEIEDENFTRLNGIRIENLKRDPSLLSDIKAFKELRIVLKKLNPDVVNTHTAKAGVLGRLAVLSIRNFNPILIHTFHGHLLYGYHSRIVTQVIVLIEKLLAKKTDKIITAGSRVKSELLEAGIGEQIKMFAISPAIQDLVLEEKSYARNKLGIDQKAIVVGWVGRFVPIKRPDRVIKLAHKFPNITFIVAGDGPLYNSLNLNKPSNCILTGWVEPSLIWSASDIALLTSDNEAIPLVLVEAATARLPLIATNVGSVCEVVIDGETGILAENNDDLEQAIEKLFFSTELRIKYGISAEKFARDQFSRKKFIDLHKFCYNSKN